MTGIEPARHESHWILSPTRIPIPPHQHNVFEPLLLAQCFHWDSNPEEKCRKLSVYPVSLRKHYLL